MSDYSKLLRSFGADFKANLRKANGAILRRDPDSDQSVLVVVCADFPGGFLLHVDESTLDLMRAAITPEPGDLA